MCKTASRYPGQPANTGNEYFPDFSKAGLISQTSYRVREIERSLLRYLSDCVDYFFGDKFDKILNSTSRCPWRRSRSSPPNVTPALTPHARLQCLFFSFETNNQTNKKGLQHDIEFP